MRSTRVTSPAGILFAVPIAMSLLCVALAGAAPAGIVAPPELPDLPWEQRSDWLSVKDAGAMGDGKADDTAAIQSLLDKIDTGQTIYIPPGTYRITKTLAPRAGRYLGVTLIGHGRSTVLRWDGEAGGRMFWTNDGMPYTRYVGLTWHGGGKAAVGVDHACLKIFETELRHQQEAFLGFSEAGIRVGHEQKVATAETVYRDCLFVDCREGISLHSFNVLDHTIDHCSFFGCGTAISSAKGTNCYVRNCSFYQSELDILIAGEQGSSVRRCTSTGSGEFLRFGSSVGPLVIQDCRIQRYRGPAGAITLAGAPVEIFDCQFVEPVHPEPPITVQSPEQRLIVSSNELSSSKVPPGGTLYYGADATRLIEVPAGKLQGVVDPQQTGIRSKPRIAQKVFDAKRDFGAKGDGQADDTDAAEKTIAAARAHGNDAIAYFPTGRYPITRTLKVTGGNYFVGGTGFRASLIWAGEAGGTLLEVAEPYRVTIENLVVGHHDSAPGPNGIDILHRGTGKPSSICYDRVWTWGMYQNKPLERGIRLENLGADDRVLFEEVNGNLHLADCAAAQVLLGVAYEGTLLAEGKSTARDGFLGACTRLGTITDPAVWLKDNQSLVVSDLYVESSAHLLRLEGDASLPSGRVTLQGAKYEVDKPDNNALEVHNYRGDLVLGPDQFYVGNPVHKFVQEGTAPFTVTLVGPLFYNSRPGFTLAAGSSWAIVGGQSIGNVGGEVARAENPVEDARVDAALPAVVRAMDDLRRLGAMDNEFHPAER